MSKKPPRTAPPLLQEPSPVPPPLRVYQEEGVAWVQRTIAGHGAALLADEMGLGKSAQAIQAALQHGGDSIVIICPAIVVPHWWAQLERWGAIAVERHPRRRGVAWKGRVGRGAQQPAARFYVYSYEGFAAAVSAKTTGKEPSKTARWTPLPEHCDFLVLDEVHHLMSERSSRSKAIAAALGGIWRPRPPVLALSGTPMTARPRDLWHPLTLLFGKRVAGSFFSFTRDFCAGYWKPVEGLDRPVWDSSGASNPGGLAALLAPVMLRRTKAAVAQELPPVARVVHEVELPAAAQKAARNAALAAQDAAADSEWGESSGDSRGSAGGPSRALARLLSGLEEHKLEAAEALARELVAEGSRPLLLTTRVASARTLGERLLCPWVCGEVAVEKRRDALLAGSGPGVATLYSLTTGIDLVEFDAVVFVGLDWVPGNLEQALARLHRLGQQRSVSAFYLVALGTLDEVVRDRVIARLDSFAAVVGGEEEAALAGVLRGGSEEELLAAFIAAAREED